MAPPEHPLRLGTRASPLAMAQAHMVRTAVLAAHGWDEDRIAIVPMVATGDRIQDRALAEFGGKALWTKELDQALLEGRIEFAVHSMKDVETLRPPALTIVAMLERADVRDRLVGALSLDALPAAATLGTSAPRRRAQLLRLRPDLRIVLLRGNVQTRLGRVDSGEIDATLLASAGLARLGLDTVGVAIPVETLLPAPAQGAVGIEIRDGRDDLRAILAPVDHAPTSACVRAERALLAGLSGDCRSPVAALARIDDAGTIHLRAEIYAPDGEQCAAGDACFAPDSDGPAHLATRLLAEAPPAIRAVFAG